MKKIISTRLDEEVVQSIGEDKIEIFEKAIQNRLKHGCPMCKQPWPSESNVGKKEKVSIRIDERIVNKLSGLFNNAKFIASAVYESVGFCALCGQRKKKK